MEYLPKEDIQNALRYAEQFIIKHRFYNQLTETRWKMPQYQLIELPEDPTLHIPSELRTDFKLYTLKFSAEACHLLSCFRYLPSGKTCTQTSIPTHFRVAKENYQACQPACKQNWINNTIPFIDEVDYRDGQCVRKISLYKKWCLFPETRTDQPDLKDVPPFVYDDLTEECHFTEDYCDRYGLNFTPEKTCERSGGQAFAEDYLIGKTIYRSYRILNRRQTKQKRSTPHEEDSNDMVAQMAKELSFDVGIDLAFLGAKKLALKSIPLYSSPALKILISNLQTMYGKHIVKYAVVGSIIRSVTAGVSAQIAIKSAAALGTASTVVGLILTGIQISGLIADLIDPLELNHMVDQKYLQDLKNVFTSQMHSVLRGNIEITPLGIMAIMSEGEYNEEERILFLQHMTEYLYYLKISSEGVNLKYDPGLTIEDYLNKWTLFLHNKTPRELETKMDSMFTQLSLFSAVLLGLFLAVSI